MASERLRERWEFVNRAIEGLSLDEVHPLLEAPAAYILRGEGKRLRPLLCILCSELVGGGYEETRDAFLALELVHNGTLIHDDIIDEDLYRRGRPSVPAEFGVKRGVLAGDILLSLGLRHATETGRLEVVRWLSETSSKMVQGVALQTYFRRKTVTEEMYLKISYLKSGSLFEAAAAIGGLVGGADAEATSKIATLGRSFGMAYQIRDDLCGVLSFEEEDSACRGDIVNGDLTLPFIYAVESGPISEESRRWLMDVFAGKAEADYEGRVRRIYGEAGALERSVLKMRGYAEECRRVLDLFEEGGASECLHHLIDGYYGQFSIEARPEPVF